MIYSKLCLANESDYARAWNTYSALPYQQHPHPQHQQQQQLMHHYAQQAAVMGAAAVAAQPLLPTHYGPQQQQPSLMQHAPLTTTNGSSNKYIEQPAQQPPTQQQPTQPAAMYHPSYYVSQRLDGHSERVETSVLCFGSHRFILRRDNSTCRTRHRAILCLHMLIPMVIY